MLRILGFAAIVALLCLGAVGATPAPTGAERIQASVSKTLNFSDLGAAGVGTIETYLAGALIDLSGPGNASYNAAWKCVKLAGGEPGSFGVQVQAGVLQGPYDRNLPQFHDTHVTLATTGDYALLAALRVSGQGDALFGSPRYVQREEGEDEASFGDRLGRVAAKIHSPAPWTSSACPM